MDINLEIDIADFRDSDGYREEDITCEECGGVVQVNVEAEIADIDYSFYVIEKEPPTKELPPKDMIGQTFFWENIFIDHTDDQ
jgi:hypothetical protein